MPYFPSQLREIDTGVYAYKANLGETLAELTASGYFSGLANGTIIKIIDSDGAAKPISRTLINNFTLTIDATGTASVAGTVVPPISFGIKTSAIGDSNSKNADSDILGVRARSAYGHIHWLRWLSMGSIDLPFENNYSVSGSTFFSNIGNGNLARAANDDSKLVIVALGINDAASSSTFEQIVENINIYVNALKHKQVLFLGVHPNTLASELRIKAYRINQYLLSIARRDSNTLFSDPSKYIADPASATGAPLAGMLYDTVHLSTTGAYYAGLVMYETISAFLKPIDNLFYNPENLYNATTNPTGNAIQNAMLRGTGGNTVSGRNITGGVPDLWTASSGGTITSAANELSSVTKSSAGNLIQFALSGTAGSGGAHYLLRQSFTATVGVTYDACCYFEIAAGASNLESVALELFQSTGSLTTFIDGAAVTGQYVPNLSGTTIRGLLTTPKVTKAEGSTTLQLALKGQMANNLATAATIRFGNPFLRVYG